MTTLIPHLHRVRYRLLRRIDSWRCLHRRLAKRRQIAVVWSIEDVQSLRPDLTDDQAWEVLQIAERQHDCEQGLNWETFEVIADDVFPVAEADDDLSD
ncbi:MAG: hypothetical protein ACK5Q5_07750 [Planctomycetaceae bacterium]